MSLWTSSDCFVEVSCHTIWYLTVLIEARAGRDWDWLLRDMLRNGKKSYERKRREYDQFGAGGSLKEEGGLIG